ncbi:AAA family ATPase [Deinococcus sp. AJ005]|uniref:AAA family ATPase n=1 Tax=Deinococcus sp. AJ005 TaxID=2652443 RepID=UPI00125CAFC5|nr:AAA family ATPase [Deinococcus sp. AJ005]QFP77956.1 ATP-binding protein [Deinococcus sp. AJ005]
MTHSEKYQKLAKVFTPASPVEDRSLFAGRLEQLASLWQVLDLRGMHGILYGERGVGKTSLINILKIILEASQTAKDLIVAKHSCYSQDDFEEVWKKIFQEIKIPNRFMVGEDRSQRPAARLDGYTRLSSIIKDDYTYTSREIVRTLSNIRVDKVVIILDEFDRLDSRFDKKLFADVIKNVSDAHQNIKIIIVGVSDDVNSLVGQHESIRRNLKEVNMPLMPPAELREIVLKGLSLLDLRISDENLSTIVELSAGYPYYTHQICYHACYMAIGSDKIFLDDAAIKYSIGQTIQDSKETIRHTFQGATMANQKNFFKEVLYACAICNTDEHGYFQASDLERILSRILGRQAKVQQFARHLTKLSSPERGNVLICYGNSRKKRYKFTDPLMRAYIQMIAYTQGVAP